MERADCAAEGSQQAQDRESAARGMDSTIVDKSSSEALKEQEETDDNKKETNEETDSGDDATPKENNRRRRTMHSASILRRPLVMTELESNRAQLKAQFDAVTRTGNPRDDALPRNMNFQQFVRVTQCRSSQFAARLFHTMDSNSDGEISFEELLSAVEALQSDDLYVRLGFVFMIFDGDGDGCIRINELVDLLKASVQESQARLPEADVEALGEALVGLFAANEHGMITKQEFETVMSSFPDILEGLSLDFGSLTGTNCRARKSWGADTFSKIGDYLRRHRYRVMTVAFVTLGILLCFGWRFGMYAGDCSGTDLDIPDPVSHLTRRQVGQVALDQDDPYSPGLAPAKYWAFSKSMARKDPIQCTFARKRKLLGWWLPVAKGCGQAMKFVFALILFPVSRNLMTSLRSTPFANYVDLDKTIYFHKVLGRAGFLLAWIHTACHGADVAGWQDTTRFARWSWAFPDDDIWDEEKASTSFKRLTKYLQKPNALVDAYNNTESVLDYRENPAELWDDDDGRSNSGKKLKDNWAFNVINIANGDPSQNTEGVPNYLFRDRSSQPNTWELLYSWFGVTGVVLIVIYTLIALFSFDYPKQLKIFKRKPNETKPPRFFRALVLRIGKSLNNFNNFWYTHQLFVIFYLMLLLHPLPGVPDERNEFGRSDTYLWVAIPLIIYMAERLNRCFRCSTNTKIVQADVLPGKVIALKVLRPRNFHYIAGQYVMINCPQVSKFEWHPFTLSSSPADPHLTLHIRATGDWTSQLYDLAKEHGQETLGLSKMGSIKFFTTSAVEVRENRKAQASNQSPKDIELGDVVFTDIEPWMNHSPHSMTGQISYKGGIAQPMPPTELESEQELESKLPFQIRMDGPFGAPSQRYSDYPVIVLIGAGIGVTPMASVLNDVLHCIDTYRCQMCGFVNVDAPSFKVKKVHFYWTVRSRGEAMWFKQVLEGIAQSDEQNVLDINIHLTNIRNANDVRVLLLRLAQRELWEQTGQDTLSQLHSKTTTHFGRPDWDSVFSSIKEQHSKQSAIGVFYCGPNSLSKVIRKQCKSKSDSNLKFDFVKERF